MNKVLTLKVFTVALNHLQSSHIFILRKMDRILFYMCKPAISFTGGVLYFQSKPNVSVLLPEELNVFLFCGKLSHHYCLEKSGQFLWFILWKDKAGYKK